MSTLLAAAPALDEKRLDQIAALPLGGRIKVDPWTRSGRTFQSQAGRSDLGTREDGVRNHSLLPASYAAVCKRDGKSALTTTSPSQTRAEIVFE